MMQKNQLITIGAILVLGVVVGFAYMKRTPVTDVEVSGDPKNLEQKVVVEESEQVQEEMVVEDTSPAVKEFAVESFYDDNGVWFSLKEINVNKGDIVKIKVRNVKGTHSFAVDEYGINVDTPLDEDIEIGFVADKAGEFVYYCPVPGHREKGQWGTLKVSG